MLKETILCLRKPFYTQGLRKPFCVPLFPWLNTCIVMLLRNSGLVLSVTSTDGRRTEPEQITSALWSRKGARGEFRPRQIRQLPRAVDLKGRFLFLVVVIC
jgi:hypothetical protein